MANRKERRKAQRQQPAYERLTPEQKRAALFKNGITHEDLKREYDAGVKDGITGTFKTIYAAICLAANETYGFGRKRCARLLRRVDEKVLNAITSQEIGEEVFERMGLELNFSEPFDRVIERE